MTDFDIDQRMRDREALEQFRESLPNIEANGEALTSEQFQKFLRDDVIALQRDVTELLTLLRPLGPALEKLPEMVEQVGPLIEAAKKSPVLRMLGISL